MATWALGAQPKSADQAQIQELGNQVEALNREFVQLKARDHVGQGRAMQNHWSMMQTHMRSMRQMPGMGPRSCRDWTIKDTDMMGGSMMGRAGKQCTMMGHGRGGGMGKGAAEWALPAGTAPSAYQQRMHGPMQAIRSRMAAISAETDPAKRLALLREHYDSMYRHMQTMRGAGWMWGPAGAASLPEADSRGARLVSKYCGQCHAPPSPTLHTSSEWSQVTRRMRAHIDEQVETGGAGLLVPSAADLDALSDYLGMHARAER